MGKVSRNYVIVNNQDMIEYGNAIPATGTASRPL